MSTRRRYESEKPTIEPFLDIVRVYIDGDDSEAQMTHRLFKNLTIKSFKVARQAGLGRLLSHSPIRIIIILPFLYITELSF